jgi:hypothetical protein
MKTQYTFDREALQNLITDKLLPKIATEEILDFKWQGSEVVATVKPIPITYRDQ